MSQRCQLSRRSVSSWIQNDVSMPVSRINEKHIQSSTRRECADNLCNLWPVKGFRKWAAQIFVVFAYTGTKSEAHACSQYPAPYDLKPITIMPVISKGTMAYRWGTSEKKWGIECRRDTGAKSLKFAGSRHERFYYAKRVSKLTIMLNAKLIYRHPEKSVKDRSRIR